LKTGIFGGSFDPIHTAHLIAAQAALEETRLDRVVLVPAGDPPHKPASELVSAEHRYRMVQLATAGDPRFEVSDIELAPERRPAFTVDTLRALRRKSPADERFYLIVGSDTVGELATWRDPGEILRLAELVIVPRSGDPAAGLARLGEAVGTGAAAGAGRHVVEMEPVLISSTEIRRRAAAGLSIRYLVPEPVRWYITMHKLYLRSDV
jgi:nicotinate-nucleotide adenylyltransferase